MTQKMNTILKFKRVIIIFAVLFPLITFAYVNPGKPTGLVNDFAGVFSVEQKTALEATLGQNMQVTGNEITVAIIKSLGGDTVDNFAEKLFKEWGVGDKDKDNGALLLVAIDDHKLRIEVGYGLEPVLTDAISSQIIRNVITPKFKQGDYYGGISDGVTQIISVTKGEYVPVTSVANKKPWWTSLELDIFLFWVGLGIIQWFFAMMARSKSWWMGGVVGAIIGVVVAIVATIAIGFIVGGILALLGLLLDYFISKEFSKSKELGTKPKWWAGGTGLGGGFGGRGGGGFGGFGGGGSGGGGSSGGW